jgi:hypothetical protein
MSQLLRSKNAFKLFLYSSWVIVSWGVVTIFMLSPWYRLTERQTWSNVLVHVLLSPLAFVAAPACLIILFGMMIFCAREDRSSVGAKILWFILFLTTACFGAAIYFFTVYRKQVQGAMP